MEPCSSLPPGAGFIQSMVAFMDCRAQVLGASAYQALAAPGSTLTLLLSGFLTLFIALFGYRLLLGRGPDLRTGVLAFVKIGIVLALATSWPAYRTLVYDVALRGPAELASEIGAPTALPGAGGGLVERLDGADKAFVALAIFGEGSPPMAVAGAEIVLPPAVAPQPYPGFNTFAIGGARMLFLIGAIAGLGAVRLVIGLLLAVGPLFVAFLLFENTRSLFEGWVRTLAGAALATLGAAVVLGTELALIEPWLSDLLARRNAQEWLPNMPVEILVLTASFALIILTLLYASAKIAFAFRLAPLWEAATARADETLRSETTHLAPATRSANAAASETRSRAANVVDAVAAMQRRESGPISNVSLYRSPGEGEPPGARRPPPAGRASKVLQPLPPVPLGQSFRRRTSTRISASAGSRDRRS
jgi:type IV secretion system protein VirB6